MAKQISLKPTVAELERATKALAKVRDKATGDVKRELDLKVDALVKAKEELIVICGHAYPLYVPPKQKPKR